MECEHYCGHPEVNKEISKPHAARNCPYLTLMDAEGMKAVIEGTVPPPTWITNNIKMENDNEND